MRAQKGVVFLPIFLKSIFFLVIKDSANSWMFNRVYHWVLGKCAGRAQVSAAATGGGC